MFTTQYHLNAIFICLFLTGLLYKDVSNLQLNMFKTKNTTFSFKVFKSVTTEVQQK